MNVFELSLELSRRLQNQKGFSYDTQAGRFLKPGEDTGYVVSLPGAERIYPGIPNHSDLFRYVAKYGGEPLLGGWVEGNQTFLDVSVRIESKEQAAALAEHYKQKAFFDLKNNASIYV